MHMLLTSVLCFLPLAILSIRTAEAYEINAKSLSQTVSWAYSPGAQPDANLLTSTQPNTQSPVNAKIVMGCEGKDDTNLLVQTVEAARGAPVIIAAGQTCAARDVTIPDLQIEKGGLLKPLAPHTITIARDFKAGPYVTFANALSGQGTISFSSNKSVQVFYSEWWGAAGNGSTDDGEAMKAAYIAATTTKGGLLQLLGTTYETSIPISIQGYSAIRGMGMGSGSTSGSTIIHYTGPAYWLDENNNGADIGFTLSDMQINVVGSAAGAIRIGNTSNSYSNNSFKTRYQFRNLVVAGPGPSRTGTTGISLTQLGESRIDNVTIGSFETALVADRTTANLFTRIRLDSFRFGLLYEQQDATGGLNDHWDGFEALGPTFGNNGYGVRFDARNISMTNTYFEVNPTTGVTVKAGLWFTAGARLISLVNGHIDYGPSGRGTMTNTMLFDPGHGGNRFAEFTVGNVNGPSISMGSLTIAPGDYRESFFNCSPALCDMLADALANNYAVVVGLDNMGSLALSGPVAIGGGTGISKIVVYDSSLNPLPVAANTSAEEDFAVRGLTTADKVIVNGPTPTAGIGIVNARVKSNNILAITFSNVTARPLTPAAGTYGIIAIRSN